MVSRLWAPSGGIQMITVMIPRGCAPSGPLGRRGGQAPPPEGGSWSVCSGQRGSGSTRLTPPRVAGSASQADAPVTNICHNYVTSIGAVWVTRGCSCNHCCLRGGLGISLSIRHHVVRRGAGKKKVEADKQLFLWPVGPPDGEIRNVV